MSFDNTNTTHLTSLKTELTTDPISMGYNLNGSMSRIVKQLNDPSLNVGGETAGRPFDVDAMMEALDPDELDAAQTNAQAAAYTQMLVTLGSNYGAGIESYKTKWRSLFATNSATVTALDAQTSRISRADVLFGAGSNITENDLALALAV